MKGFDWTHKVDPETGETLRFCTRCQNYLSVDSFYASTLKSGVMRCKTHSDAVNRAYKRRWVHKNRGAPRSVERLRANLNKWLYRQRRTLPKWTDADVERALRLHGVDLAAETRSVSLRPRDPQSTFSVENSVVHYRSVYARRLPKSSPDESDRPLDLDPNLRRNNNQSRIYVVE